MAATSRLNGLSGAYGRQHPGGRTPLLKLPHAGSHPGAPMTPLAIPCAGCGAAGAGAGGGAGLLGGAGAGPLTWMTRTLALSTTGAGAV